VGRWGVGKQSAGVVIRHPTEDNLVLATSRGLLPPLRWVLVGGIVDPGETPLQAALREAWEETGVRLTKEELHPTPFVGNLEGWETTFWLAARLPRRFKRWSFEGWVAWKPISTILRFEPYADYNRALFLHFGLPTGGSDA
tara:strand:+ start:3875 stop:4297 length:423 start_codon:yes stop_codon:yes gene_type:complete